MAPTNEKKLEIYQPVSSVIDATALNNVKNENNSFKEDILKAWGKAIRTEDSVWSVFNYFWKSKESDSAKTHWNRDSILKLSPEIRNRLASLCKLGMLVINFQENISGLPSTHPIHGWGPARGYIYQKAHIEFFLRGNQIEKLKEILEDYPLITYHIISKSGKFSYSNSTQHHAIALSWGVFPGQEIFERKVFNPEEFLSWKEKAFKLLEEYNDELYENEKKGKAVNEVIDDLENFYLVNLIYNEYPKEETVIWKILQELL